jgi:hypothetical protein
MARLNCYKTIPNLSFISAVLAQGSPGMMVTILPSMSLPAAA